MSDKPEFPPELVKRCEMHAASVFDADERARIVIAILRESRWAELVATLEEARSYVSAWGVHAWGSRPTALEKINAVLRAGDAP